MRYNYYFIVLNCNHKERTGKEVEVLVVWACDEKRGTRRRKVGNGNESTREEKGLSSDDVYDRATWRRISSYIDPHKSGNKMKEKKKKIVLNCTYTMLLYAIDK